MRSARSVYPVNNGVPVSASQASQAEVPPPGPPLCPSARADMPGAVVFGVVGGTVREPQVTYLSRPLAPTPAFLALAAPVEPDEVFRFTAPCAEHACQHFQESKCQRASRISSQLEAAVDLLPRGRLTPDAPHSVRRRLLTGLLLVRRVQQLLVKATDRLVIVRVAHDPVNGAGHVSTPDVADDRAVVRR